MSEANERLAELADAFTGCDKRIGNTWFEMVDDLQCLPLMSAQILHGVLTVYFNNKCSSRFIYNDGEIQQVGFDTDDSNLSIDG